MNFRKKKTGRTLIWILAVTILAAGFITSPALAQEDVSETVGMDEVSNLIGLIGASEEVDEETIITALEGLSEDIIDELEERGVSEEIISNFEEEFGSSLALFEEGLLTRSQFADEASESVGRLGRDSGESLPVELLEENGVNTEAIQQLKEGAEDYSGLEVAEIARSIAGKGEKEGEEKGEEAREKAEEKKEEAREKGEEGKMKDNRRTETRKKIETNRRKVKENRRERVNPETITLDNLKSRNYRKK